MHVGQTLYVKATLRDSAAALELEVAEPLLASVHPLPVNIRAPLGSPALTHVRSLVPGTAATVLARVVGFARGGEEGLTLQVADATGEAQLRVTGDDYAFWLGQNVLFQSLAVVAPPAGTTGPALRFNHSSSVIVEPDMPGEQPASLFLLVLNHQQRPRS